MNPFINKTEQQYNSVPFEDIKSEHFLPAIKHYIKVAEDNINDIILMCSLLFSIKPPS